MARPTIITDALIADFCSKLRVSGSIETAIKATGIGRESYYGWARKVRDGAGTAIQRKFIRAVDQAEGEIKMMRENKLSKHFDKHWQALAWWLERKYSPEYGQRRPPPLPDPDQGEEAREIERVVWAKGTKKTPESQIAIENPEASPEASTDSPSDPPDGEA